MSSSDSKREVGEAIYAFAVGARPPRPELQILREALRPNAAVSQLPSDRQTERAKLGAAIIRVSTRGGNRRG